MMNPLNTIIPTVVEGNGGMERAYDIYSRLLKDRIIILSGEIDDNLSNSIVAQLLYLDSIDSLCDFPGIRFKNPFNKPMVLLSNDYILASLLSLVLSIDFTILLKV